ncbi:MAG: thioredoxin [Candidatus Absconditabacterales bacterium]|jgi:thioredoxin 1
MSVLHIESVEQFKKEILENPGLSVIDFRAERCGPCRMLGPIIEQLADEYKDVKIAKINVDENQELASTFQVSSIPVVFFIKNGKVVDKIPGVNPPTVYKEKIAEHSAPVKSQFSS